ncbi:hypothetical protein GALMADRAFT_240955 [Galerina marginata CBS 339.88]|uniref:Uncharacterized protein n=1 Tax=Galerina marginata (strain CBS 339.88) TaxID=685588 RepID=A0A067TBU3_GALM3|nr:hypothetical protein GALMADRAFT_240955 [Galerina marginata CBS 339.88]
MPHYHPDDEVFPSNSRFLAPSASSARKSPSRQNLNARRSTASLRAPSTLTHDIDDNSAGGRHHSLAHELAVALMPEPSAGSKLLAEEFGIEFDEGTEGIDEGPPEDIHPNGLQIDLVDADIPTFASELEASATDASIHDLPHEEEEPLNEHEFDPVFNSPTVSRKKALHKKPEQDAMEVLAQDLESTDKFLSHLRGIDLDPGSSASQQPALERLASDVIRRMNLTVRDREGHVRELLEYEREFRKIAGEVGGNDILGQLDELAQVADLLDKPTKPQPLKSDVRLLDVVEEEPTSPTRHRRTHSLASDWELDPERHRLGDEDEISEPATSPIKDSFPLAPSTNGPPTPATTVAQLTHLRSYTTSLVSSLSTISEQAQVNGAATTEAGRKIRALKNKLGGWRTDWDSAERSRIKIEKWEAGIVDGDGEDNSIPASPGRAPLKRVDGRRIVEEQLRAFELALAEAAQKTQAIMARSASSL